MKLVFLMLYSSAIYGQSSLYQDCLNEFKAMSSHHFDETLFKAKMKARRQIHGWVRCDYKVFQVRDSEIMKLRNNHQDFVGIQGMKDAQFTKSGRGAGNLTKFREWAKKKQWYQFSSRNHFDWWMFPISDQSSKLYRYSVLGKDVETLKSDPVYLRNYREGVKLMLLSWGWSVEHQAFAQSPSLDQQWRGYEVRLRKLVQSLILFEQQDYLKSTLSYVKWLTDNSELRKNGQTLQLLQFNKIQL